MSQLKKAHRMSSGQEQGTKILGMLAKADAERFLSDLANWQAGKPGAIEPAVRWFFNRNKQIVADIKVDFSDSIAMAEAWFELSVFQQRLRKAWKAPDVREREWYSFQLLARFWKFANRGDARLQALLKDPAVTDVWLDPPPVTAFEAAIFHLKALSDKAKYCAGPDCAARYFVAQKRWQKYCSEKCAGPANREAKRRWWHENKAS